MSRRALLMLENALNEDMYIMIGRDQHDARDEINVDEEEWQW